MILRANSDMMLYVIYVKNVRSRLNSIIFLDYFESYFTVVAKCQRRSKYFREISEMLSINLQNPLIIKKK